MSAGPVTLTWPSRRATSAASPRDARPLLRWKGALDDGINAQLWAAEAVATLDHLLTTGLANKVDMFHLDPPFGSEADYDRRLSIDAGDRRWDIQLRAYGDKDRQDIAGYLEILEAVLRRAHALLAPSGALYLHLDPRRGPYAKVLLDEVFGVDHFVNQVVWAYGLGGSSRRRFQRKHDTIYLYAKDPTRMYFAPPQEAATSSLLAGRPKLATDVWETLDDAPEADILRAWPDSLVRKTMSNRDKERTGYPTQKPLSLATRMVLASCPEGGLVVDPMAGSGTVLVAAALHGRRVIGGDRGGPALDVCRARLLSATRALSLGTLDEQLTSMAWEGPSPVCARHGQVSLLSVAAPERLLKRLKVTPSDTPPPMDALWSAWGTCDEEGLVTSCSDAGPARSRATCAQHLPRAGNFWWGVDVAGNVWRGPLA